ncbi:unnamed protein product [Periconia digitata]|uniref:SET domain-containing protein n=1 Tax=Periconia digitata TaxID=1303443 RepID=A0A9W4UH52_9PLEO|nr:unnamed protein product [Periconia digitata]
METTSLAIRPKGSSYQEKLDELLGLQKTTSDRPYSIIHRLNLAKSYLGLGYPELAASDAYKALLLVDEVSEEAEFHEKALEAALADLETCTKSAWIHHDGCTCESAAKDADNEQSVYGCATTCWLRAAYDILVPCLIDVGCLRSAFDYNARALKAFPGGSSFTSYQSTLSARLEKHFKGQGETLEGTDIEEYPDKGSVRRELYPWNEYEPDRYAPDVLEFLNSELEKVAPKLEVKVSELPFLSTSSSTDTNPRTVKQLGVFARQDIPPNEVILREKSLLTAISRLHDTYCDACSAALPHPTTSDQETSQLTCEDCFEVFYCSPSCQTLAEESYHPSVCSIPLSQKVSAKDAADELYTLLLIRAIALAEQQDLHPLELKEVRYIWGDYHSIPPSSVYPSSTTKGEIPRTLPFSWNANVLRPLHILSQMDVNIFTSSPERYDTWIFNTLYAKFRGTASARQSELDGRPELSAVHPLWCLANHSCDPNVSWVWEEGEMRFWVRGERVEWSPPRDGEGKGKEAGLKKGEEVFSHYCDISLSVKERREWAVGALGGVCVCERCVWEASH